LIYAAEQNGSVVAYRQQSGSTTVWTPQAADNPQLVNQSGDVAGSVFNLFNNSITMAGSGTNAIYTLAGADGSTRTFAVASYTLPCAPNTPVANQVTRQRPYLQQWTDSEGNYLTFAFGNDNTQPDWGLLNRITSSNGNFVQLDYDIYGHIIAINAADGRRLSYNYDSYGDLIGTTLPDASTISYTYSHQPNTGTSASGYYSEHLITQETKPEGRVLVNTYEPSNATVNPTASVTRRVSQQQATVGANNALVTSSKFTYSGTTSNSDGTWTGSTKVADANNLSGANSQQMEYDYTNSQITTIIDQLGQKIQHILHVGAALVEIG